MVPLNERSNSRTITKKGSREPSSNTYYGFVVGLFERFSRFVSLLVFFEVYESVSLSVYELVELLAYE
jgi:hypothetical protein